MQGQQPTWSAKFLEEFRTRRGYDPLPYLPAMARRIVDNREKTDRFLFDIRMTISDLMIEKFFGRFAELAHARGVGIHCETGYGTYPHPQFDGLRAAGQCDVTMGEFWWGTDIMSQFDHFCNVIRSVASPAHIYGKKIVQAESFTSWSHFLEYPATLKPLGDEAFCDGLNRIMFHQYTHQPNEDMPGYQYGAGTHIDRHVTWWNMSDAVPDLFDPLPEHFAERPLPRRRLLFLRRRHVEIRAHEAISQARAAAGLQLRLRQCRRAVESDDRQGSASWFFPTG